MTLDSAGAKRQFGGDLGVGLPGADQLGDFLLAGAEHSGRVASPAGSHPKPRAIARARSAARRAPIRSNSSIEAFNSSRSLVKTGRLQTQAGGVVGLIASSCGRSQVLDRILQPVLAGSDPAAGLLAHPLAPRRARDKLVDPRQCRLAVPSSPIATAVRATPKLAVHPGHRIFSVAPLW